MPQCDDLEEKFNPTLFDYCSWPTHAHIRGHILTFLLTLYSSAWFCLDTPTGAWSNKAVQNKSNLIFTQRPVFCCSVSLATMPLSFLLCKLFASSGTGRAEEGLQISPMSMFDAFYDKTVIDLPFLRLHDIPSSLFKWNESKCIGNVKWMRDWQEQMTQ